MDRDELFFYTSSKAQKASQNPLAGRISDIIPSSPFTHSRVYEKDFYNCFKQQKIFDNNFVLSMISNLLIAIMRIIGVDLFALVISYSVNAIYKSEYIFLHNKFRLIC